MRKGEKNSNGSKSCIMVIDDDAGICKVLKKILETRGYRVVIYSNAIKALEEM